MAEGLAPCIAENAAALENYSGELLAPGERDSGISARLGGRLCPVFSAQAAPRSLCIQRLLQCRGGAVAAVSRVHFPGAVPGDA